MKTILLPTDFSDHAMHAIDYAFSLYGFDPQYILLNTYYTPDAGASMVYSVTPMLAEESEKGVAVAAEKLKNKYGSKLKLKEESILGNVSEVCNRLVKKGQIDLIVMGTKGASGLREVLLGSNTASTIQLVECPVLAIPLHAKLAAPKRIALATDHQDIGHERVLDPLVELLEISGATLSIVHVQVEDDEAFFNAESAPKTLHAVLSRFSQNRHEIAEDSVIEGLEEFVDEKDIDMLAMVEREYSFIRQLFHRSVTKHMAMHTDVPLLALQDIKH